MKEPALKYTFKDGAYLITRKDSWRMGGRFFGKDYPSPMESFLDDVNVVSVEKIEHDFGNSDVFFDIVPPRNDVEPTVIVAKEIE